MLLLGKRLFGFWLPFMGWRQFDCYEDGEPIILMDADESMPPNATTRSIFCIEWFDHGLLLTWIEVEDE